MTSGISTPPVHKEEGRLSLVYMVATSLRRKHGHGIAVSDDGGVWCQNTNKQVGDWYINQANRTVHYAFYPTEEMIKESNV